MWAAGLQNLIDPIQWRKYAVALLITAVFPRNQVKYGERGYRFGCVPPRSTRRPCTSRTVSSVKSGSTGWLNQTRTCAGASARLTPAGGSDRTKVACDPARVAASSTPAVAPARIAARNRSRARGLAVRPVSSPPARQREAAQHAPQEAEGQSGAPYRLSLPGLRCRGGRLLAQVGGRGQALGELDCRDLLDAVELAVGRVEGLVHRPPVNGAGDAEPIVADPGGHDVGRVPPRLAEDRAQGERARLPAKRTAARRVRSSPSTGVPSPPSGAGRRTRRSSPFFSPTNAGSTAQPTTTSTCPTFRRSCASAAAAPYSVTSSIAMPVTPSLHPRIPPPPLGHPLVSPGPQPPPPVQPQGAASRCPR